MAVLPCLTPEGQVTIPRSILKSLGIGGGTSLLMIVDKGELILKKVEDRKEIITNIPETRICLNI